MKRLFFFHILYVFVFLSDSKSDQEELSGGEIWSSEELRVKRENGEDEGNDVLQSEKEDQSEHAPVVSDGDPTADETCQTDQRPLFLLGWTKGPNGERGEPVAIPAPPGGLTPANKNAGRGLHELPGGGPLVNPKCQMEALKTTESVRVVPYKTAVGEDGKVVKQRAGGWGWWGRVWWQDAGPPGIFVGQQVFRVMPAYTGPIQCCCVVINY